jgi:molybdopterin molybdotransferase
MAVRDAIDTHPEVDLVVTTGGVSAGAFEVVRDASSPPVCGSGTSPCSPGTAGSRHGAARRCGARGAGRRVPGQPVSALLSFEMFLRPVLRAAAARTARGARAVLTTSLARAQAPGAARHAARGRYRRGEPAGSHLLRDYARATVLVHVPIGVSALPAGAEVEIWRIDE